MKKILFSILFVFLFIPYIVNATECDPSKVYIDSIKLENLSANVKELEDAIAQDKNINLHLKMSEVNDSIQYKVVLKNDSNEDYLLDKNSLSVSNEYFVYSFDTDNSNVIKANSTKILILNIQYKNEVPESLYDENVYKNSESIQFDLKTEESISNPNTGVHYRLIIISIILLSLLLIIIRKEKTNKVLIILISLSILMPISIKALCSYSIKIDASIELEKKLNEFCIKRVEYTMTGEKVLNTYRYSFDKDMTWNDFVIDDNKLGLKIMEPYIVFFPGSSKCDGYLVDSKGIIVSPSDKIKPCSDVTYEKSQPAC